MFNVGGPEILVVLLVALVVLGPEELPKAMKTFGNIMGQVRKLSSGFQAEMRSAMNTMDVTNVAKQAMNPSSDTSGSSPSTSNPASGAEPSSGSSTPVSPTSGTGPVSGVSSADRAAG